MKINNQYVFRISLIVALGGFLMGFDASVISGVIKFIEPEFNLSKLELGWAVSSLTLTATLAMIFAGGLSDRFGRKRLLTWAALLYGVSAISSAIAPDFITLVISRMIGGFGVGISLIIAPMYIAEIAPPEIRGKLVSLNQLNIVMGISAAFFTNYLILKLGQSDSVWAQNLKFSEYNWRWMLGLEALPALLYFLGLFIVPCSPRWLIMAGREIEALKVLAKTVGDEKAMNDLKIVKASIQEDITKEKASLKDVFKPVLRSVLIIGIVLAVLQQITGINSVFFYAPMIFEQSGIGTDAAFTQAIYVGIINLLFTIAALLLIDKIGRKPLLSFGVTGIVISMFVLAYGFSSATYTISPDAVQNLSDTTIIQSVKSIENITYGNLAEFRQSIEMAIGHESFLRNETELTQAALHLNSTLILIAILAFVASFAISIGPVMWVLFSELFPNRERAVAISFVGFINSVVSFGVQFVFPWELKFWGASTTFLIYGIFAALGLIFILTHVPETKGKTLEELSGFLLNKNQKKSL
ncbi:MAG: sugar porter family MFS transporter [Bacteroidales bacterium]|jgi:sugar porter (SP) family MFS transporter|nr:sugar porter family MFS transporter [Bacteroidales bacterium]